MATVRHALEALELIAPKRYAFSFDKVGLQVGSPDQPLTRAVVSLDRSLGAVAFAREVGAELLLAHHPLIFRPIESVDTRTHVGRTILELVQGGISFVAAHTNWDSARGGVNDALAELLGLEEVRDFGTAAEVGRFKLVTTCPTSAVDSIIDAASSAGAGVVGAYSRCAYTGLGHGTFVGDEGSSPAVGSAGVRETVEEVRVEMVVSASSASAVVRAVQKAHPYEEPVRDLYVLRGEREQAAGRIGRLETTLCELAAFVDERLNTRCWAWGDGSKRIRKVAVVGGSADEEWMEAQRAGADVLITGEVKQHVAVEASESGMCLIAAGHFATEHPGCAALRERMSKAMPDVEWVLFEPAAGLNGRPF
ncbi:MAG: Nif3-like dinuclear metal center hexameric protein [Fimbriimonas sp.]